MFKQSNLLFATTLFVAACGGPEGFDPGDLDQGQDTELEYAESASALGEASCGNFGIADSARLGTFDYRSPTTYSNPSCYKAVVADTYIYDATHYPSTTVRDDGAAPTSKSACEALYLRSDLMEKHSDRWAPIKTSAARGIWTSAGPGVLVPGCILPRVTYPSELIQYGHYRIAATARTSNGSGASTRPVKIYSVPLIK